MLSLPMSSNEISIAEMPDIYLAGPNRDRQIDEICQMIRNSARAGIFNMKYNFTFLGVVRTSRSIAKPGQPDPVSIKGAKGRGESYYNEFIYEGAKQDPPLTIAGPVSEDLYWERITYFLERVVPVATEYKVKIGCHPQDPSMPRGKGWRGIQPVLGMGGRSQEVRLDQGEPVSRPELLHGDRGRDARQPERGAPRHHPVLRHAQEDSQRALPQHPGRLPQLPRDLHRQRRHRHVEDGARVQGSRLRGHAAARSHASRRHGGTGWQRGRPDTCTHWPTSRRSSQLCRRRRNQRASSFEPSR